MKRLLVTTTAACVLTAAAAPVALAGSGTDAFIGGTLGGVLGGVIGNTISRPSQQPAPPPPPQKEIIYIDREPARVIERQVPVRRAPVWVHDMSRGDLADLQRLLNRYGTVYGFSAGVPDGLYGRTTRHAVSEFQSLRGLPVTGVPSYSLLAEARRAVHELDSPATTPVARDPTPAPAAPSSVESQKIEVNVVTAAPPAQPVAAGQPEPAPAQPLQQVTAPQPALEPQPPAAAAAQLQATTLTASDDSGRVATVQRTTAAAAAMPTPAMAPSRPASFEVAGVRLAATRADAKAAIRQFSPSAVIEDVVETAHADLAGLRTDYVSRIAATLADVGSRTDRVEIWFGPNPQEDEAEFIVRTMQFGAAERPATPVIEQSLVGKYGEPHLAVDGDGRKTLSWAFTSAGDPASGGAADLCAGNIGDGYFAQPTDAARGNCGFVMVADINAPGERVSDLVLRVRDLRSYFENRDRFDEARLRYARGGGSPPPPEPHEDAVQPVRF